MELIERRRALIAAQPRLPWGYQEVEWIQTVRNKSNIQVPNSRIIDFETRLYSPTQESWAGITWQLGGKRFVLLERVSSAQPYFSLAYVINYNETVARVTSDVSVYTDSVVAYRNGHFFVNGTDYGAIDVYKSSEYMHIGGQSSVMRQCRFYYYVDAEMHLIPCYRKSDNEGGVYDIIGDSFTAVNGTSYTLGPDIN